jgi:3-oxoacyl-[acyl-carrier protein] reductase
VGILAEKNVLVTGGSRGIGSAVVRAAMEEGAQVAFTYRSSSVEAEMLAEEMTTKYPGQRCLARQADATDTLVMETVVKDLLAELGHIDGLVNNAGLTRDAVLARMTRDQWDAVIEGNLGSLFSTTKAMVLQMVKQRAGSIVNLTSISGLYGKSGQTNYAAAKAGVIGFTKALSAEVAPHNVRVNAVAPGFIQTDMTIVMDHDMLEWIKERINMRRLGSVDDVAPLICFLMSEKALYITGQVIQVDGGITL